MVNHVAVHSKLSDRISHALCASFYHIRLASIEAEFAVGLVHFINEPVTIRTTMHTLTTLIGRCDSLNMLYHMHYNYTGMS